ncbi:hypothetical protein FCV25MIE_33495 [Fagus crenata]
MQGFWDPNVRRRAAVGGVGNNKGKEILLPQTTEKDINFKNQISVAANKAISINATLQPPKTKVKARVEASIKLELVCEPTGVWEVARAQVVQDNSKAQLKESKKSVQTDLKNVNQRIGPPTVPAKRTTRVWQPKYKLLETRAYPPFHGSSSTSLEASSVEQHRDLSCNKLSGDEDAVLPLTMTLEHESSGWAMKSRDEVSAIEPSSEGSDWALQLQDGRCLVMPSSPMAPLSSNPFFALSSEYLEVGKLIPSALGGVLADESIEDGEIDMASSLEISKYKQEGVLRDVGDWDEDAMWVEPLAISLPDAEPRTEVKGTLGTQEKSTRSFQSPNLTQGPQSNWGLSLKEFGEYLGASYEGFEDRPRRGLPDALEKDRCKLL